MVLPRFNGKGMNNFLSDDNVGRDEPVLNKSGLRVINVIGQMRFKSITQGFNN